MSRYMSIESSSNRRPGVKRLQLKLCDDKCRLDLERTQQKHENVDESCCAEQLDNYGNYGDTNAANEKSTSSREEAARGKRLPARGWMSTIERAEMRLGENREAEKGRKKNSERRGSG
ncbi:hypothetical protein EYF80_028603 [Liparis tanakae]|uniref:Uncharacterized protein n=1 Tax=Liparis tanakae TaxID=230148 RepID=A0A4Z2H5R1_9TELE|nr:hypothetical protein EYF80_028603 [Liparis tanakae]